MGFDIHFMGGHCVGYMAEKDKNISFKKETDLISGKESCYLKIKDAGEIYLYDNSSKYQYLGTMRAACVSDIKVIKYLYEHFGICFYTDNKEQDIFYIEDKVNGKDVYSIQHWMMIEEMLEYIPDCVRLKLEYKKNEELMKKLEEKYNMTFVSKEPVVKETIEELEKAFKDEDLPF